MKLKELFLMVLVLLASCFACFSLLAQVPTSGLVAYWPLNGNYNDAGPYGINGTNFGSTATPNKAGTANAAMNYINLSGSTNVVQYGTLPVNSNINFSQAQNFTISLVAYINSSAPNGGLFDNNLNSSGYGTWFWAASGFLQIQFNFGNGSIGSTNGAMQYNTWTHICCVKQGTALRIYINGVLNATGTTGSGTPSYSLGTRFGTLSYTGYTPPQYNGHNGKLDEVRLYNRALSAAEILQMTPTVLPLKLGNFTAVKKINSIQLDWKTITEQNTSHFEIERSNDGNNFDNIGRVNAAGNSYDSRYYNFIDVNLQNSTVFYRLKMIDIDGAFTYSNVIAVKNNATDKLQLFPNPASDNIQVQLKHYQTETAVLLVSNAAGQTVLQKQISLSNGNNAFSVPVMNLKSGQYSITINTSSGKQSLSFIKN